MFGRHLYYELKPFLPLRMRRAVRGALARHMRPRVRHIWPILESAAPAPERWPGWPDRKKFALVLTHDVESPEGLEKCRVLAQMEKDLGFRSSFNFIPEGPYRVSQELRADLTAEGFEIGVHDLHHDGKLFRNHAEFLRCAARINRYLKEWNAVGFRAGFMLRNLPWLHHLEIEYDSSTFDTDPFEPQPDGAGTIFPFFVARDDQGGAEIRDGRSEMGDGSSEFPVRSSEFGGIDAPYLPSSISELPSHKPRRGYVELPYTLAQDSTLFLLLREKNADLWKGKLDWIANHGGMALLNIHPDYIEVTPRSREAREHYPLSTYRNFLEHIRARYAGEYWHALPKRVAAFCATHFHPAPDRLTLNEKQ